MEFYIGDPLYQADHWELQNESHNCAVASELSILHQFGVDLSMDEANYFSSANGWYTPGFGTSPDDVGNLLQAHGIPTHSVENATIQQLAGELQQGHRVIVGVNSDQLWDQGPKAEFLNWVFDVFGLDNSTAAPADHAVVVTGIDFSDIANPQVIINDPGKPEGAGHKYPLDHFIDAWENSDFNYVSTSIPPGGSGPIAFDIAEFLGWGTTAAAFAGGFDPASAMEAGRYVHTLVSETDWDVLLASI